MARWPKGVVYYHHNDHLGTIEVITDENGTVVWEADYEAFGSVLNEKGDSKFTPSYTGKFFDKTSGLYYFNARWYDSELGKFTVSDPIRDGVNWWNYCNGNPLSHIDPDGKEWLCRIVDGVDEIFYKDDIASNHDAKKAYGDSAYVLVDGQQYGAFTFYNNNGNPYMTDPFGNTINQTRPIQGENYDIFPGSATKQGVNPDTLHKKLYGN